MLPVIRFTLVIEEDFHEVINLISLKWVTDIGEHID